MNYFTEAFNRLRLLENDFDITVDAGKVDELRSFVEDDIDMPEEEIVFDADATSTDELADSYVGKVVIQCTCCGARFYKNAEDITYDEESELVNVEEDCPICHTAAGFKVIGKIEEISAEDFTEIEDEIDMEAEDDLDDSLDELLETTFTNLRKSREKASELNEEAEADEVEDADEELFNEHSFGSVTYEDYTELDDPTEEELIDEINGGDGHMGLPTMPGISYVEILEMPSVMNPIGYTARMTGNISTIVNLLNETRGIDLEDLNIEVFDHNIDESVTVDMNSGIVKTDDATIDMHAGTVELELDDEDITDEEVVDGEEAIVPLTDEEEAELLAAAAPEETEEEEVEVVEEEPETAEFDEEPAEEAEVLTDEVEEEHVEEEPETEEELIEESLDDEDLNLEFTSVLDALDYWDKHHEDDPVLADYDNALDWIKDSIANGYILDESFGWPMDLDDADPEDRERYLAQFRKKRSKKHSPIEFGEDELELDFEDVGLDPADIVDDLDESFDYLVEAFLKKVYGNVSSYETTNGVIDDEGNLLVEGVINFDSGNSKPTAFNFKYTRDTKRNKVIYEGINKTFSNAKAFTLKASVVDNRLLSESLFYNFNTDVINESVKSTQRIHGRVRVNESLVSKRVR